MSRGKAVHTALEANYRQKILSKKDLPAQDVKDVFSTAFDKEMDTVEIEKDFDPGAMKDSTVHFIDAYQENHAPKVQPAMVEEQFEIPLTQTVCITGFIDLVQDFGSDLQVTQADKEEDLKGAPNKNLIIVDHKVGSKRAKTQNDADHDLQLTLYAEAMHVPNVRFDSLLPELRAIKMISSVRTPADIKFALDVSLSIAQAISTGIFPKTGQGTWKCSARFCPHYFECHDIPVVG
jgi:hypothetical protein